MKRVLLGIALAAAALLTTGCVEGENSGPAPASGEFPAELRLDYAYYNPASLVLREQQWLEQELGAKGTKVTWVLSAGSNKANESLRANAVDLGSTAGAAALLARANATPIKVVTLYSQPEWAAIVVGKTSTITSVAQLKGRKVAATKGTDPYFFLLQSLKEVGLTSKDVEVVNLQHADGKAALERGDVDAWAGLDPIMAQTQVDSGSKLIYRNKAFNSYGTLNAREDFLAKYPAVAQLVVNAYEKAKAWIAANPDQAVELLARESKVSPAVARLVLTERTTLDLDPVPGDAQRAVLQTILPVLVADGNIKSAQDGQAALDSLFEPRFAQARTKP
ncbi:aliphatic sulfonate ABC transporter substrate-binding protein [Dactylosporangium sp. AC04546]|uniref:aliphatic sulfonate ABC transporter substrate-binding protein n=1 Tax=Dactylosporangium sp. AC04546 TaxID=2862460 RepID=UPI001EDF9CE1|nr:aliphatic sulfonate ABC transporter substrate-binding protein [Dactylosporangium sp. AC04546]WVK88171.1 aliphatic sulfonate ABC transporter substrate-binding protein [Dactylosporangium sp. AC04546]